MTTRAGYESKTAELVGRRIAEVKYWDVHNFSEEPRMWDHGDWHHAVMGVELITDRGPSCVLWTDTFFPYGVEAFHTPITEFLASHDEGPESWCVNDSSHWLDRFGTPVTKVETLWERLTIGPGYVNGRRVSDPYEVDVPIVLRLDFEAGPVWMVAGIPRWSDPDEVLIPGDEIMVVFSAERMRRFGFQL